MKLSATTLKAYTHILLPTGLGGVVYVLLSGLAMVRFHFTAIQKYLYVPSNLNVEGWLLGQVEHGFDVLFGADKTNTIVLALFWAVVGFFVYLFLRSLGTLFHEMGEDLEERRYIRPQGTDPNQRLRQFFERLLFQFIALILAFSYFSHIIVPLVHGHHFVSGDIWGWLGTSSIVHYVVWFFVLCLAWHGFVILLRLTTLRLRLFG
jgi:hypothetical protein